MGFLLKESAILFLAAVKSANNTPAGFSNVKTSFGINDSSLGVFVNGDGTQVVIAWRGSAGTYSDGAFIANPSVSSPQIENALALYEAVRLAYPNAEIDVTGLSMGGMIAEAVAATERPYP